MNALEKADIQGLIFSGYGNMPHASYHPLKFSQDQVSSAKQWLKKLIQAKKITHGAQRKQDWCLNIAFTRQGLEKLGISKQDMMDNFDNAFVDGMDSERRQTLLQDNEESKPDKWSWGSRKKGNSVDLVLMIYSSDDATLNALNQEEQALYQQHGLSLVVIKPFTPAVFGDVKKGEFRKEHFGFADGISQPLVEGFPATAKVKENLDDGQRIAPGEFVLGYENEYDRMTKIPKITSASKSLKENESFGVNGTYLVFRQLEQNVSAFWNYFQQQTSNKSEQQWMASKCMGRWPSGVLIDEKQTQDPASEIDNTYDFSTDVQGQGCPIGSHVRRANPRAIGLGDTTEQSQKVVNLHRIIRRARSYGKPIEDQYYDDEQERGLFFICINANIERQFEFVQHTWINNVKFNSLYDEKDPIIGAAVDAADNPMTIPKSPVRKRLHNLQRFVTTRGGGYFFLPGLAALRTLADI